MHLETLQLSLPVHNYDPILPTKPFIRHSSLFSGNSKRTLIVGKSGCGKTNVLMSLLLHANGFRFKNVYLCCKSLQQSKYAHLKELLQSLPEIGYYEFTDLLQIPTLSKILDYSVIIFDDVGTLDLDIVKQFFSFGRHKNLDCIVLIQTYSAIPKQLLRDNANLLILFQQDVTNLKHVYDDHIHDLSLKQFLNICKICWVKPFNFLFLDLDCAIETKYRLGFDKVISLK